MGRVELSGFVLTYQYFLSHRPLAVAQAMLRRYLRQMVGETGWQLSHGERSRVYLARALLQGVDLVVLDESFSALDPGKLQRTLRCVHARARAVLVIAHP